MSMSSDESGTKASVESPNVQSWSTASVESGTVQSRSVSSIGSGTVHSRSMSSVESGTTQSRSVGSVESETAQSKSIGSVESETAQSRSMGSVESGTAQSRSVGSIESGTAQPRSMGSVESGTAQSRSIGSVEAGTAQSRSMSGVESGTAQSKSMGSVESGTAQPRSMSSVESGTVQSRSVSSIEAGTVQSSSVSSIEAGTVQSSSVGSVESRTAHSRIMGSVEAGTTARGESRSVMDNDSRKVRSTMGSNVLMPSRLNALPEDVVTRLKDSGTWGDIEIWHQENEAYIAQLQEHARESTQAYREMRLEADNAVLIMKSLAAENDELRQESLRQANGNPGKASELRRSYDALAQKHNSLIDTNAASQSALQQLEEKYADLARHYKSLRASVTPAHGIGVDASSSPDEQSASCRSTNQGFAEHELSVEMWRERVAALEKERARLLATLRDVYEACDRKNPSHCINEQIGTLKKELAYLRTEMLKQQGQQSAPRGSEASAAPTVHGLSCDPSDAVEIKTRLSAILREYDRVEGQVIDLTNERTLFQKEKDILKSDYQSLQRKYAVLEHEHNESSRQLHVFELHAEQLERQYTERTRELRALEAQSAELHAQMRATETQAESEHAEALAELRAAKNARVSVEEHLANMQLLHNAVQDDVEVVRCEKQKADVEPARLRSEYGDAQGMQQISDELKKDGDERLGGTQKTDKEYVRVRSTHNVGVGKVAQQRVSNWEIADDVTGLQEEQAESTLVRAEQDNARAACAALEVENDETTQLLDEQRSANLVLITECNAAKSAHNDHLMECDAFRAETEETLRATKHEYDMLRAECDELHASATECENKFAIAMEENSSLLDELSQTTSALRILQRLVGKLEGKGKGKGDGHGAREVVGQNDASLRDETHQNNGERAGGEYGTQESQGAMELKGALPHAKDQLIRASGSQPGARPREADKLVDWEQTLRASEVKWFIWMLE